MADRANADEGADPSDDIRKQNPGETTTADLAEEPDDDPSGANKPEPVEDRPNVGQVSRRIIPRSDNRAKPLARRQSLSVNEVLRPPSSSPGP